jgi:hypothetical protein
MPGARLRPVASRAKNKKHDELVHHGHTGFTQHSPRNGFTVSFVLSPVTGLVCHRRPTEMASVNLMPASGHQDHTTSPYALCALRLEAPKRPLHPAQRS